MPFSRRQLLRLRLRLLLIIPLGRSMSRISLAFLAIGFLADLMMPLLRRLRRRLLAFLRRRRPLLPIRRPRPLV